MTPEPVFEEVRECREAISALTRLVVENHRAEMEKLAADQQANSALLNQILAAVQAPVPTAVIFGWNGDLHTYPIPPDSNEVIIMSDFSLPDSDSAVAPFTVVDADGNTIPQTAAPTVSQDVTTFGMAVAADAANDNGSWNITFVPTTAEGVGTTNVTVQAADPAVPALSSAVTTDLTEGTTATAVWADSGLTVTAAPPADAPPATA